MLCAICRALRNSIVVNFKWCLVKDFWNMVGDNCYVKKRKEKKSILQVQLGIEDWFPKPGKRLRMCSAFQADMETKWPWNRLARSWRGHRIGLSAQSSFICPMDKWGGGLFVFIFSLLFLFLLFCLCLSKKEKQFKWHSNCLFKNLWISELQLIKLLVALWKQCSLFPIGNILEMEDWEHMEKLRPLLSTVNAACLATWHLCNLNIQSIQTHLPHLSAPSESSLLCLSNKKTGKKILKIMLEN